MLTKILIGLLCITFAYLYYLYRKTYMYFEKFDIKCPPVVPFLGNYVRSIFQIKHIVEDVVDVYNSFPNEKYIGSFDGFTPIVVIRDPQICKNIVQNDFDHFTDHRSFVDAEIDPILGNSLVFMQGAKWKKMRATLSPAFTGAKMRLILPSIVEIAEHFIQHLKEKISHDICLDDTFSRVATDVIASSAFGYKVNSLQDRDNEFYTTGQKMSKQPLMEKLEMFLVSCFPNFSKLIGLSSLRVDPKAFFKVILKDTLKYREENNVQRPDMIQLILEASKNDQDWSENELIAQVMTFFFAGFETTASIMTMACHELTLHPEIQQHLFLEIYECSRKNSELSYESLLELKYLDMVVNETLRKWTPGLIMDRECQKAYTLEPPHPGGKPYTIKPKEAVYCMINGVLWDAKYFPEPKKFDPDRFSEQNKHKIQPFTFMPFGGGPRICIGSRFALMEIKVMLYFLLLNFKLLKSEKTIEDMKLQPIGFRIAVKGGSWIKVELRK